MLVTDIFTEPLKDTKILNRLQAIDAHNRNPNAPATPSPTGTVTSANTPIFIVINKMDIYNKYLRREDGGWEEVVEGSGVAGGASLGQKEGWKTYAEMSAYWKSILPSASKILIALCSPS